MRHTCEHCKTPYFIPDDKVAGRFLKVRCKRCTGTMHVVGLRLFDATGANGAVWWAAIGFQPRGPYREDEVLALVASCDISARTRMWCCGMETWARVCESETLAWVYSAVIDCAAHSTYGEQVESLPSGVFERAALLSDGNGYFPDPTLKSGIVLLADDAQLALERLATRSYKMRMAAAARGPQGTRAIEEAGMLAPVIAAAVGALSAASGIAWFLTGAVWPT